LTRDEKGIESTPKQEARALKIVNGTRIQQFNGRLRVAVFIPDPMRLSTRTNVDEVFAEIDRFMATVHDLAIPRALNRLRDQAQVAGLREIGRRYGVGPRTMEKYVSVTLASANDPLATVAAKGRGFTMAEMHPVKTSKGTSVLIKGKRHVIPHAFMVARFGKHVFARGAYGGKGGVRATGQGFGRFQFGKGRLPINELYTFGPATAFGNDDVTNAMQDRVEEQAAKVLRDEIRFAKGGA
jgi:hypothetical protein